MYLTSLTPPGTVLRGTDQSPDGNSYTRWWTPGVAIGAISYMGSYGHSFTYNVKTVGGAWKSIAGGYGLAFSFGEGNFTMANTNSFTGADQAVTWYDRLVVSYLGNVGIGTAAAGEKLHLYGSGNIAAKVESSNTGAASYYMKNSGTAWHFEAYND